MSSSNQSPIARYPAHAVGAVALGLLLFSFRAVLGDPAGGFLGDSTDAAHHVWGLWWFGQAGHEGEVTALVSFPTGERGALLSPITAALTWPLQLIGGPAFAYNGALFLSVALASLGTGLLTGRLARSAPAGAVAATLMLIGRPLHAHLGLGLLEGVAVGWAALALWQATGWLRGARAGAVEAPLVHSHVEPHAELETAQAETTPSPAEIVPPAPHPWSQRLREALRPWSPHLHPAALLTGLLFAAAILENPYSLILMAPAAAVVAVLRLRPWSVDSLRDLASAALGGLAPVVARLLWLGGDLGGNPTPAASVQWLDRTWSVLDTPRLFDPLTLLQPFPVMTFGGSMSEILSRGGDRFLGLSVLGAAALGVLWGGRAARVAVGVALVSVALAAGSLPWGQAMMPGPFFFLNAGLSGVLPGLTQPDRFLVFASAALAVAGGVGVAALVARRAELSGPGGANWRLVMLALGLEGLLLGGPALAFPTSDLRQWSCFAMLTTAQPTGAVHLLPTGDISAEQANSMALKLQLLHRLPGTHHGIGGWDPLPRPQRLGHALASLDGSARTQMPDPSLVNAMKDITAAKIGWIVADESSAPAWLGRPRLACGGWGAWALDSVKVSGRHR